MSGNAYSTRTGVRTPEESSIENTRAPPPVQTCAPGYDEYRIMRQKAYIKVLANIAKKTEDMHGELERDMEHQQEKILLHIKIESTRSKYLPDNASRKMRRQWFCRRIYLKLRWFHEYGPMNKIIQVMERTMAIATLLSGWSMLLKHTLRGELPHGWPFSDQPDGKRKKKKPARPKPPRVRS